MGVRSSKAASEHSAESGGGEGHSIYTPGSADDIEREGSGPREHAWLVHKGSFPAARPREGFPPPFPSSSAFTSRLANELAALIVVLI